jgi:hypothetical protein
MALKVTKSIGTNRGITQNAYIRIADYQISKSGSANFRIQLYMDEAAAKENSMMMGAQAQNIEIGESLNVSLMKEVEETYTYTQTVQEEKEVVKTYTNDAGEEVSETVKEMVPVEKEMTGTRKSNVIDLSPLQGVDIFAYAYGKLKEKLISLYGATKVEDC